MSELSKGTVKFDTYTYLLSLPYLLGTDINNIPCKNKYLEADNNLVSDYKEKYFNNNNFKIGIFWQGNPEFPGDKTRSMPLKYLYPLFNLPNLKIYSLQKGYGVEQLKDLPENTEIVELGETFNDLTDTAAAIENLDLVIGTDTLLAHLAAALGKPVWLLLSTDCDWRWSYDIEYSYWYDNIKIFR